jgi:hypothetical protein
MGTFCNKLHVFNNKLIISAWHQKKIRIYDLGDLDDEDLAIIDI